MGRASKTLDSDLLKKLIIEEDTNNKHKNRSHLFKEVANLYGKQVNTSVSPAWVYLKAEEFQIALRTPKGKRGKQKGEGPVGVGERRSRGEKLAANPAAQLALGQLKRVVMSERNGKFLPIFKRLERGSLKAAIQLNCLYCVNFQPNEVRHCECLECPLHSIRPYQTSSENTEEAEVVS